MKKRIISAFLAMAMMVSMAISSLALTAEEKLENILAVEEFMKDYSISVGSQDEPMMDAFKLMLENDAFYNQFMHLMLSQYDRYSLYVPAGNYEEAYPTNDNYVGIGVTMEQYGTSVRITAVTKGSPAEEAGFKAGDLIVYVDRKDYSNTTIAKLANVIRGEEGKKVTVTVKRTENGKDLYITRTLTRKFIKVSNFASEVLEDGIFYMDLTRFADTQAYLDFVFALQDMVEANTRALILDLRGNPGGEVNMALNLINRLIPDEDVTYFMTRTKINGQYDMNFYKSDGMGVRLNKIIILQDSSSASASEIVIASLTGLGYAESVGDTTYGKARGQYHVSLPDGSVAVINGIELIAPGHDDYDVVGLAPDHEVYNVMEPDEFGIDVFVDKQMEKALEVAREYAAQPQQYTVDRFGNFTNIDPVTTEAPAAN
ncbi:MAG: PDZ domain-containing protein [Clostridia bacterium]|nr:PDZ domain-containing protein [Clostridia bacterium]